MIQNTKECRIILPSRKWTGLKGKEKQKKKRRKWEVVRGRKKAGKASREEEKREIRQAKSKISKEFLLCTEHSLAFQSNISRMYCLCLTFTIPGPFSMHLRPPMKILPDL